MKNLEVKYLNRSSKELFDLVKNYSDEVLGNLVTEEYQCFEELITFLLSDMFIETLTKLAQDLDMSFLTIFVEFDENSEFGKVYRYFCYTKQGKFEHGLFFDNKFTGLENFDYNKVEELKGKDFEFITYED